MKTTYSRPPKLAGLALLVASVLGFSSAVESGSLSLATEPLGTATSSIKPNVMFLLDDSASMEREYMPDYVMAPSVPDTSLATQVPAILPGGPVGQLITGTAACFDSGDAGSFPRDGLDPATETAGDIAGPLDQCRPGDPPYMSPDFNTIYYNPAIYYRPGVNYDGTEMPSMDALNTSDWTRVPTDGYNVENWTQLVDSNFTGRNDSAEKTAASAFEADLASGYPDRVWCTATTDLAGGGTCRQNSAYTYPNYQFPYGTTDGTRPKYVNTAPYYYRMQTAQYCLTNGTDCRSGSAITSLHTLQAAEFCTDSELTNCAAGSAVTASHTFSGVRWCSDAGTLQTCQRKKIGSFVHAKHVGTTRSDPGTFLPVPNEGQITVGSVNANGGTITSITIGGVTVVSGPVAVPSGSTTGGAATTIAAAIDVHLAFNATAFGSNVIITQAAPGSAGSGAAIVVNTSTSPSASAKSTITLNAQKNNTQLTINSITVGGTQLLCPLATAQSFENQVSVTAPNGHIVAANGYNEPLEVSSVLNAIAARITACGAGTGTGYSAVRIANEAKVEITAPLSAGSGPNGSLPNVSGTSGSGSPTAQNPMPGFVFAAFAGGAQGPTIATTVTTMSGGADAFSGTRTVRIGVGRFTRTDITPAVNTYPRAGTRIDCLSSTCSYEEEMTNFANWYTYYRSRMKMMKTAAGRSFASVDDTYRVGFITVNPGSPVTSTKYLRVSEFTTGAGGHKEAWYTKLYGQSAADFSPLREALSRVGWLFAGRFNTGLTSGIPSTDDPMTASCQPNFAILSTQGYWNEQGGQILGGGAIGNQDHEEGGYTTRASGTFDGALDNTTATDAIAGSAGTLADVAMYYYKTDLRTTAPYATNNVPITNKDSNAAQHMVTFTVGLGLDGELTYRSDYETATSGDFTSIKAGLKNWPAPRGDTPSAIDDLWHAAVNGRGVFFSARDPETLSTALTETLSGLQTRIGAGAAAATSNLQPVAGDNFAFTAQYQTSDWIGDLKAKTIDLSSGIVSSVTLWSASSLLNQRAHATRNIFTYDSTDSAGNLMKNLCWAAGSGTCSDGGGLTDDEKAYFNPGLLLQYPFGTAPANAGKLAAATGDKVLNFFRGERTYEDSGGGAASDLFRRRETILGDIINAQPSYVKKSPFGYQDAGYSAFQALMNSRRGTVYAAANDGYLHAFETDVWNNPYFQTAGIGTDVTTDDLFQGNNAGNGVERWAYVPGILLPNVYKLANNPYSHRYFTDGSPQVGDICVGSTCGRLPVPDGTGTATASEWRTILVAGLNSGGIGYYALDITDPMPNRIKVLWEFTNRGTCYTDTEINTAPQNKTSDCHLGLSYGNPLIAKRKSDGKWVVIVTSGYNNNVSGGDGKGYLYILDAATGVILNRLTTGVGTAASPSGLAKINGWATNANLDNTALAVYGGDLEGNLWRFQLDSDPLRVVKVATVHKGGVPQPITVKPELGPVPNLPEDRMILFGTGKFLENADKTDTSDQTIYALKDVPTVTVGPVIADVRSSAVTVRTLAAGTSKECLADSCRTVTTGAGPSWTTQSGWLIDLPEDGERVNVDPQLQLGTLVVASNIPSGDTCTAGGFSWLNFLDYATGSYVPGATGNMASTKFASSLAVGINVIMLPGGKVVTIVTTADNQQLTKNTPVPNSGFAGRRVSWRELIKE